MCDFLCTPNTNCMRQEKYIFDYYERNLKKKIVLAGSKIEAKKIKILLFLENFFYYVLAGRKNWAKKITIMGVI